MNQEPHHQRLTYIRNMRVFELTLAPGESTADYVLDHDGAIIALTDATVRLQRAAPAARPEALRRGRADLGQFTGEPVTQRLENAGTRRCGPSSSRTFAKGMDDAAALTAPGTTLQQENRSFAVYDMRLNAREPAHEPHPPESELHLRHVGRCEAQGGGGEFEFPLEQTRTWWFPGSGPDQPHTLNSRMAAPRRT